MTDRDQYARRLDEALAPDPAPALTALDLFAGCGGLALGFEAAGVRTLGFEMKPTYAATYNRNLLGRCEVAELTPDFDFPDADIVIGGPPCQPFSVGGHQLGLADSRDGFPTFIAAVERLEPKVFMFENVRGMMYRSRPYLDEILEVLSGLGYAVSKRLLNASHYGVPQNRQRVFVIGHRAPFRFPKGSEQRVTAGDAVGSLVVEEVDDPKWLTPSQDAYIARYETASKCKNPRDLHLDRPSRTVTCRNLAGATGDMMRVRLADGRRRRLTVREAARLQTFPDWFSFEGSETDQFYQVGNAVPPLLSLAVARAVVDTMAAPRFSTSELEKLGEPSQLSLQV